MDFFSVLLGPFEKRLSSISSVGSMAAFEGIDFHEKWGLSLYSSHSP
jgi:hypothetical protein